VKAGNAETSNPAALDMTGVAVGSMRDQTLMVAEDVTWQVMPGQYWVMAGLQGAGKSDFLMMTAGLMAPVAGTYRMLGEPMPIFEEARVPHRLRLGLVFESGQLFNHLTVRENVALPLRYHRNLDIADSLPEVQKFLDWLGLETWADSTPGAIGHNWQRRVGLARALILRPEILLLDNPLGGLDLPHAYWWLNLLDQLVAGHQLTNGRPLTVVVTTADLRPWQGRPLHFAILRNRRLNVLGSWAQVEGASRELLAELVEGQVRSG
jgi:phospholipid/cholesterol/gamma-HCH transport system ATP-binding protein